MNSCVGVLSILLFLFNLFSLSAFFYSHNILGIQNFESFDGKSKSGKSVKKTVWDIYVF